MNCLKVSSISLTYGATEVLSQVNLPTLQSGDILGLLGPNAAGKSSLMQVLSGQAKYQGDIILNDRKVARVRDKTWLSKVGYMPQTPPQTSSLLPYELLWNAARAVSLELSDDVLNNQIAYLFKQLGLEEFAYSPLYTLSGGKRQLVGLALALLRQPEILLLDEPTSALDLHWRMVVLDFVAKSAKETGGIVIAALHDLDLALRYCNKLMLLNRGEVVAAGKPLDVLTKKNIADVYRVDADIISTNIQRPTIQINSPIRNP